MKTIKTQVLIIGGGPAGMSAAIQLKRQDIDCIVFEENKLGGLLLNANFVENYPGFPQGISGKKLCELFIKQFLKYNAPFKLEKIKELSFEDSFKAKSENFNITADYCILAAGTVPKDSGIEHKVSGRISSEIYHLLDIRDKDIYIIGSGDAAFDYALSLSPKNHVVIFAKSSKYRALPLLIKRAQEDHNISIINNIQIQKIEEKESKVLLYPSTKEKPFTADIAVIAVGREANSYLLRDKIESSPNFFMAGDIQNGEFRQVSLAAADGVRIAMEIYNRIR